MVIELPVQRMPGTEDMPLPRYATPGSAGMDLLAAVDSPLRLLPGGTALVPTGLRAALPPGYEGQIRPRSGLALRHGVTVLNAPGTIDADYRGEIKVLLINLGPDEVVIERGDRVAQMIVAKVARAVLVESGRLEETGRGDGGFGHTGV